MANPVTDLLEHINHEVSKLSTTGLNKLTEVLDLAEVELTRDLAAWSALGKGDDRLTAQMYRNALIQIRGTLQKIRGPVAESIVSVLRHNGVLSANLATKHLITEVTRFSQMFEGSVRPVAIEAASVLAEGKNLVWKRFSNSVNRYAGKVGEDIHRQLAIGVVKGETVDQLTNRLAKLGGPRGLVYTQGAPGTPHAKAEYISEGLFRRYRNFAERLVVTETVNAYNSFALEGMDELEREDPGYFKRWDAAIDARLCPQCAQYDDLVVPLNGKFKGVDHPPLHPRCRCAVVIWRKEWKEAHHKDDLLKETIKGVEPKGVASIPHRIDLPKTKNPPASAPKAPSGFSWSKMVDGSKLFTKKPELYQGVPTYKQAKTTPFKESAYVVHPSQFANKRIYGVDTGGENPEDSRTKSITEAWKANKNLAAIEIDVNSKGHYFIADGNHRFWAALLEDDRPIMVRFRPVQSKLSGMDSLATKIKKALNPVK